MSNKLSSSDVSVWLGTSASHEAVIAAQSKIQLAVSDPQARHMFDTEEEERLPRILSIDDTVATVRVHGSLTSEDSFLNFLFGITSYNEIREAIIVAVESDAERIVLDIDSGGGSAKGVDDLADFIKFASTHKPIVAHISGSAFSAAYWIASAADSISGSRMTQAGSIGVIVMLQEITKMAENEGVKFHVIRSGKFKAIGNQYEELSEEFRAIIQAESDTIEGFFLDAISENRGIPRALVKSQVGEGLTFFAKEAVDNGLMDEVLSVQDLLERLIGLTNSSPNRARASTEDNEMGIKALKPKAKVLTPEATAALAAGASDAEVELLLAEAEGSAELTDEQIAANLAAESESDASLTPEQIAANLAAETAADPLTDEQIAANLAAEDEGVALVTTVDPLTAHLKEENAKLRADNTALQADSMQLAELNSLIPACTAAISEYVSGMSVRLGGAPLDTTSLELPALMTQYASTRKAMLQRYPIGGAARVEDEESENHESGSNVTNMRSVNSNIIR